MLRDISCHEKNLDLRLDLCTKRTVTTFTVSFLCLITDAPISIEFITFKFFSFFV